MNIFEIKHSSTVVTALTNQTITTGTVTGEIIDTKGYEGAMFVLTSGTITDGAFVVTINHGNDSGLSDTATVDADETLEAGSANFADTDDDTTKSIAYIGKKRYIQLNIVATGATTGGPFSASVVKTQAHHQPTAV
jgi:hypothetical protein